MRKDPTEFRERFKRWKSGEKVYEAGKVLPTYDDGKNGTTVSQWVDAIYQNDPVEQFMGNPSHNYDFAQSDEWADAHGYYKDKRGHRDDRIKKPAHPSHPSKGTWYGNEFKLSEIGIEDPNYTLFGLNDNEQDPQAVLTYKNGIVIPEITVTPEKNYINNSYDNIRLILPKYDQGTEETEYIPQNSEYVKYGELPEIEVYPDARRTIKPKFNEEEWQNYWGNKGASAVNKAQNEAAQHGFTLMSALSGNPLGAAAGIAGQIVGESLGANLGGAKGAAIGGLIGGLADPQTVLNVGTVYNNLALFGNKSAKVRLIGKELNNIIDNAIVDLPNDIKPAVRFKNGDIELNDPNLFYHLDKGDHQGVFGKGSYIKDGKLYPGQPKNESQIGYSWWNKGKPYIAIENGNPEYRLIVTTENPDLLHVRSQQYPIGQWNGRSGFITNSEYVASAPIDVSDNVYRYVPGHGYRKHSSETSRTSYRFFERPSSITSENAKNIPDATWDYWYNKALQDLDINEAQRLRDLHFVAKSNTKLVDVNGMPVEQYHTVTKQYDNTFNEFNPNIEGRRSAIYTTDDLDMSRTYATLYKTEEELIDEANRLYKSELATLEDIHKQYPDSDINNTRLEWHKKNKDNYIQSYVKALLQPDRTKRLYVKTNNPHVVEGHNNHWNALTDYDSKYNSIQEAEDAWYLDSFDLYNKALEDAGLKDATLDFDIYSKHGIIDVENYIKRNQSTRDIEKSVITDGFRDAVIINDVLDYGGVSVPKEFKPAQVVESFYPENLKYSAAVTYDNVGNVIPLSKRDNFSLRDLRYGILPFVLGSGALYNSDVEHDKGKSIRKLKQSKCTKKN